MRSISLPVFGLFASLTVLAVPAGEKPDFSGRWVLASPGESGSDPSRPRIVQQTGNSVTVEDLATDVGPVAHRLYDTQSEALAIEPSRASVAWWTGDRLVIRTALSDAPARARNPETIEITETWWLDAQDMLHIEIIERRRGEVPPAVERLVFSMQR